MAGEYTEKIKVIIENIIKGEGKVQEMTKNYQVMGNHFELVSNSVAKNALKQQQALTVLAKKNRFLSEWSQRLGVNTSRVRQAMGAAGITFNDTGQAVDLAGKKVKDLGYSMRRGEIETRRFNMSLLSVMFAGMALQKSMGGLLRPAAETAGIFDIFGDILEDTFAPIMELLEPIISAIGDVVSNMGDGMKLAVGAIVLFLFAGGVLLALGGQLGLAYGGLSIVLAKFTLATAGATTGLYTMGTAAAVSGTTAQIAFAPFVAIVYAIIAVVGLVIAVFYYWDDITSKLGDTLKWLGGGVRMFVTTVALFFGWLGDKISEFKDEVLGVFVSIWEWIVTRWEDIQDLLAVWTEISNTIKKVLSVIWEIIKIVWNAIWDTIKTILGEIWNVIKIVWGFIWNIIKSVCGFIWEVIKVVWTAIWETIKTVLRGIWNVIKTVWNSIWDTLKTILSSIWDTIKTVWNWIYDWLSEKLNNIKTFFSDIWTGIKDKAFEIWEGIKGIIKGAINIIIGWINKLLGAWNSLSFKVPKVKVGKFTFGGYNVGVPQIPNIPLLAEGGIVTKPTMAMIGERGPEAVVPLNKKYGGTINFSPTYNITVSDKSEFESMIRFNNTRMVEDLRRLIS